MVTGAFFHMLSLSLETVHLGVDAMNPTEISSPFSISVTTSVQISSTDKWWVENRLTLVIYYKREVSALCYSINTA